MNHNQSWSWASPFPSPDGHFLIGITRSHGPENAVVTGTQGKGVAVRREPRWAELGWRERAKDPRGSSSQPRTLALPNPTRGLKPPWALASLHAASWKADPLGRAGPIQAARVTFGPSSRAGMSRGESRMLERPWFYFRWVRFAPCVT